MASSFDKSQPTLFYSTEYADRETFSKSPALSNPSNCLQCGVRATSYDRGSRPYVWISHQSPVVVRMLDEINLCSAIVLKLKTAKSSPKVPPSQILLIALNVVSGQQAMTGDLGPMSGFHIRAL